MLEKFFKLKENGTNVKTEVMAGITTFMTMAYILAVNPSILSASGMDANAVLLATALASFLGTVLMALLANYPFALAPGMGLNAYFAYTVVLNYGYSWQIALMAVFAEGLIFIVLSVTNVREAIFNAIPMTLKSAVSAGIGLFIAFIGLQNAKIVVNNDSTLVSYQNFKTDFSSVGMGALLALIGVLITGYLLIKKVKGGILFGILITWVLGILCELIGIYKPNPELGMYSVIPTALVSFDFSALERWTALCQKSGIQYLEIAHLFTQWGAYATPKIMACVDGEMKRIFGWDVPADSPAYREFLESFLPALKTSLGEMGYDREHVYFHISDEPSEEHMDSYLAAKRQVLDLLEGYPVIDALSSFSFYQKGIVKQPVPANDHIQPFLDARVPGLWVYYCCCQGVDVPNRFYAMPSQRNRIMGVLMYLHRIEGFLHWGYNFYYTQFSRRLADPYRMTHADYAFPSGDAYLVYPGEGGMPLTSIRAEVQSEGLADIRILDTLEQKKGRQEAEKIIYGEEKGGFTFRNYPHSAEYLLSLREKLFDVLENG